MDDPETGETAGILSAVWMAAMCACFPTKTNHRLDRCLGGGPAAMGFGAEPQEKVQLSYGPCGAPSCSDQRWRTYLVPTAGKGDSIWHRRNSSIPARRMGWHRLCHRTIAWFALSSPKLSFLVNPRSSPPSGSRPLRAPVLTLHMRAVTLAACIARSSSLPLLRRWLMRKTLTIR